MTERINGNSVGQVNINNNNEEQQVPVNNAVRPEVNSIVNNVRDQHQAVNNLIQDDPVNVLDNLPDIMDVDENENPQGRAGVHELNADTILGHAKSLNVGHQEISELDDKLFVTSFVRETEGQVRTGSACPNLAKMQSLASDCDVEFKINCAKNFKNIGAAKDLRVLYNASTNNAQRAYVDLIVANLYAHAFANEINKKLPAQNRDAQLAKNLQALIGNMIAAASLDEFAAAKTELMTLVAQKTINLPANTTQKIVDQMNNLAESLAQNKEAANRKITNLANSFKEAADNISKADPELLKSKSNLFVSNRTHGFIPTQCGVISNYMFNADKNLDYTSFVTSKIKIDKLLSEKEELDRILKDPNLKGYTVEQIRHRIKTEAFGNEHLLAQLKRYENKCFGELQSRVEELFNRPGKNDAFANEMMGIFSSLSRDLTSEKVSDLLNILREKFNSFDPAAHEGFSDSLNFKTLKSLILKTGENQTLRENFSEVSKLLAQTRYSFKGFNSLGNPTAVTELQKINAAVSVLEEFAAALSNPERAQALIESKYNAALTNSHSKQAFFKITTALARNTNIPALKQQCGFAKNMLAVRDAVEIIRTKNAALPAGPDYGADTAEIVELLNKIGTSNITEINSGDLKRLLAFAVNVPLPELDAIWNTVLYAAYHAAMQELIVAGSINDAPARIYQGNADGNAPDAGEASRDDFIASLDVNVRTRLEATLTGLVRESDQTKTVTKLAESLNAKLDDKKALNTVLVASDKGRSLLALKEMRQDIYTFGDKWSFSAYDDISDPDEIIRIGINKDRVADGVNSQHKITDEYAALQKKLDSTICMPTISELLSAQKLGPTDSVKGENVAATISLLKENLVDDASQLDQATLSSYGIDNKELITVSKEDMNFAKDYADYLLSQNEAYLLGGEVPADNRFTDENVAAFQKKCKNALDKLEEVLASQVNQNPLSKVTKLLLKKYTQISTMLNGNAMASFRATLEFKSNHQIDPDTASADDIRDMQRGIMAHSRILQNQYFDALINGNLHTQENCVNQIISSLTTAIELYDADQISVLSDVVTEKPLSVAEKKELISNLKILDQNIDTNSFTEVPEDPENGKTAFSKDLHELSTLDGEAFTEKLNAFIGGHLTLDTTTKADSLLVYKSFENRHANDAAQNSASLALSQTAMEAAEGSNLHKIKTAYMGGYGNTSLNREAEAIDTRLTQSESELVRPLSNKLMNNGDVRDEVRLASSYAAAKLGYAGKKELYEAYQSSKTSKAEKLRIENQMVNCLKVRGFDTNLARMLSKARLIEPSTQFALTKLFRSVKSHFFSFFNDLRGIYRSAKIFFGGLPDDEAEKRAHDFHEYLPALKETVSRIGENEIRYVTQNMDFKVSFNPLAGLDLMTGGTLDKNGLLKLKASLALKSNAAMVISRNAEGKINLFINASILKVGVEAEASFKPAIAGGAKATVGVGGGVDRVLELKFDTDDEAAAFLCKMYTAQLSDEDVRMASDASSGNTWNINGKAQVKASLHKIVQGFLHHEELDKINNEKDDDAKNKLVEQYAEKHPVMNNIVKFTDLGSVDLSYSFSVEGTNKIDNTGSTQEKRTVHVIGKKIKLIDLKSGSHKIDYSKDDLGVKDMFDVKDAFDFAKDTLIPGKIKSDHQDDPEKAKKFKENVESISKKIDKVNQFNSDIYRVEHITSRHISATTGNIDAASDKSIANKLTEDDLDNMEANGLINPAIRSKLEAMIKKGEIVQVTFVRTLKNSVIENFRDDKEQLEKAVKNVKDNFILSDVIIETKGGPSSTITNDDWLSIVSGGYASYKTENKSNSNYVINIKATNL